MYMYGSTVRTGTPDYHWMYWNSYLYTACLSQKSVPCSYPMRYTVSNSPPYPDGLQYLPWITCICIEIPVSVPILSPTSYPMRYPVSEVHIRRSSLYRRCDVNLSLEKCDGIYVVCEVRSKTTVSRLRASPGYSENRPGVVQETREMRHPYVQPWAPRVSVQ